MYEVKLLIVLIFVFFPWYFHGIFVFLHTNCSKDSVKGGVKSKRYGEQDTQTTARRHTDLQ